jgi:protein-S-isoprenylcysteine O-methyltransferase
MSLLLVFCCVLAFYHVSEFALAATYMHDQLGWHSWLVSKPYCIAMFGALMEYAVESRFLPGLKQLVWSSSLTAMCTPGGDPLVCESAQAPAMQRWISWTGLALVIIGEGIRKAGMVGWG